MGPSSLLLVLPARPDRTISRKHPDALQGSIELPGARTDPIRRNRYLRRRHRERQKPVSACHTGDAGGLIARALVSESFRLRRSARRILRTRNRLSIAADSGGRRPSAQIDRICAPQRASTAYAMADNIVWFWSALAGCGLVAMPFAAIIVKMAGPVADHGVGSPSGHLGRCWLRAERPVSATRADCVSVSPMRFASCRRVP